MQGARRDAVLALLADGNAAMHPLRSSKLSNQFYLLTKERLKDKLRNFGASGGMQCKGAAEVREEES